MNKMTLTLFFVVVASSISLSSPAIAQTRPSVLKKMGYSKLHRVSDEAGTRVRGKGFFIGGDLQGQAILAAGLIEYQSFNVALSRAVDLTKVVEFDIKLSDYRQVLGPEFQSIDLSTKSFKVKQVVDFSDELKFNANYTNLRGSNVVFGAAIRIVGGVFP